MVGLLGDYLGRLLVVNYESYDTVRGACCLLNSTQREAFDCINCLCSGIHCRKRTCRNKIATFVVRTDNTMSSFTILASVSFCSLL